MPENGSRAGRGGIQRSHNEMDGYAKEREIYSVPIRQDGKTFVKVEKKGVCQRDGRDIQPGMSLCELCKCRPRLHAVMRRADRGMHARSSGRFALGNRLLSFTRADRN